MIIDDTGDLQLWTKLCVKVTVFANTEAAVQKEYALLFNYLLLYNTKSINTLDYWGK